MVYTVTTFPFRLRLYTTPTTIFHELYYIVRSVPRTQPVKGSARVISYINKQLDGYVSTERPVCSKSRCDSFSRWQQQRSFPPVTSVHFWITNGNSTFYVPRLSVSLVLMGLDDSTHTRYEWMKIGKLERGGGPTGNSLLKRVERRGDTETSLIGQWGLDSLTVPRLHTVVFVLLL